MVHMTPTICGHLYSLLFRSVTVASFPSPLKWPPPPLFWPLSAISYWGRIHWPPGGAFFVVTPCSGFLIVVALLWWLVVYALIFGFSP